MRMTPRLSVVLCAHNPNAANLGRVLQALAAQTLPASEWELVLVDNASQPPLPARRLALPPNARIVPEPQLGLTPARLAGFAAARAPVLVMIDDDNIAAPDYLEQALGLMQRHPEVGAAGGRIRGEFGAATQPWMRGYLDLLALRDFGNRPIRALVYNEPGPWEPCGAGMVLRAEVARAYAERAQAPERRALDRVGRSLSSCGDTDLARTAGDLGLYMAYEPALHLTHIIPAGRMRLRYLARLTYCIERDAWTLLRMRGKPGALAGWKLWAHLALAPVRSMALDPRRWLLRAAAAYGRIRGRAAALGTERAP
jgi:glycosyltransferase involved in cell wall biosynthesis